MFACLTQVPVPLEGLAVRHGTATGIARHQGLTGRNNVAQAIPAVALWEDLHDRQSIWSAIVVCIVVPVFGLSRPSHCSGLGDTEQQLQLRIPVVFSQVRKPRFAQQGSMTFKVGQFGMPASFRIPESMTASEASGASSACGPQAARARKRYRIGIRTFASGLQS
jgi:hypothetical protein